MWMAWEVKIGSEKALIRHGPGKALGLDRG